MSYCFVHVDGPLRPVPQLRKERPAVSAAARAALQGLVAREAAHLVLMSSWMDDPFKRAEFTEQLRCGSGELRWELLCLAPHGRRDEDVRDWLAASGDPSLPWVVLDTALEPYSGPFRAFAQRQLVLVDPQRGLCEADTAQAAGLLRMRAPPPPRHTGVIGLLPDRLR
eukprot:TRINITY_DN47299_c0_g1_i1.p1 TRINITY_DN47299_c0_g1~~TRINITY_DN47299_c0_g1_i1.p1  ORF type:complete len:192 (+),score=57.19 TRINITY_DN47299_c0_g1_i1:73-576(+)